MQKKAIPDNVSSIPNPTEDTRDGYNSSLPVLAQKGIDQATQGIHRDGEPPTDDTRSLEKSLTPTPAASDVGKKGETGQAVAVGIVATVAPMPPLSGSIATRQTSQSRSTRQKSQPGAFAAAPGQLNSVRQTTVQFSLFGHHQEHSNSESSPGRPALSHQSGPQLSEATPINEEKERANLPGATPVDTEAKDVEHTKKEARRKRLVVVGLAAIVLAIVIALVISVTLKDNEAPQRGSFLRTSRPTPTPSESPTVGPTSATVSLIDPALLPNSTVFAIQNPLSPQHKAYEWLALHPALSNMTQWSRVQLFAMATFFFNFHGEDWEDVIRSDWLVYDKSECDWYSDVYAYTLYNMFQGKYVKYERDNNETTCNELGEFTRLNIAMPGSKTSPTPTPMPPEIALLIALEEIRMDFFSINGPMTDFFIPELKSLHNLRSIHLNKNALTGTIPLSIFDSLPAKLEELVIKEDLLRLSGTLPSQIQLFSDLKTLQISNGLNGTIPSVLGKLTLLESLWLPNERMTGFIPSEIYGLTHLKQLNLAPSSKGKDKGPMHLTGTLSPRLNQLTNLDLLQIAAQLSGTIPNSIQDLVGLERLVLHHNKFSGPPPLLGQLSQLSFVDLSNNWLEGPMPEDMFTSSAAIMHLDLSANFLSGTVPSNLWSLTSLMGLSLANNAGLVGDLPASQLKSFSQLGSLKISANSFRGTIPFSAFSNSSRLSVLQLDNNTFSGSISSEVGLLRRLSDVNLANNHLTGSIPAEIGNCTWLNNLQLQGNLLSGAVPTEIGLLLFLAELNLSKNTGLVGPIPSELGLLNRLKSLPLHGTGMTGSVPAEVCALKAGMGALNEIQINCSVVACSCNCTCA